jgi:hypothetical protein
MTDIKMPKALRLWIDQFIKEGESARAAAYHAIDRCYESGDLSAAQADKYSKLLLR